MARIVHTPVAEIVLKIRWSTHSAVIPSEKEVHAADTEDQDALMMGIRTIVGIVTVVDTGL